MANDLKRVGLVFKEEGAIDFKKSLQEINIEMQKNYNQFKLTQAQWDSSTKTTEKLRAEQEYLKNAYEIQEDKVKTLRMQLSDLENAENKNTTAIKKKQNELTNAELKLESYNKKIKEIESQLNNTGKKIEEFGQKVENAGGKIEGAGKKLSAFSAATTTALVASAKSAIDFEDAFTGVEKTVDGTEEQMAELKQGIRDMAKEIPSSTTEISAVAEAAGQLGIKTEDILSFTKVMIDLGNSTNLSAEEAASSLAKFANVTKMNAKDYDKLGSTIVALGNNFATTEADIVSMSTRLAATGELAGLSQSQILSLATAMSSVGIEAEAGGSAMSKLLKQIQVAVETGSNDLDNFAKVAGMTSKEFKKSFEKDAVEALSAFISGLNDTERNGKSAISILNDMGIKEVRLSNTILSLANSSDIMNKAVKLGNEAWEDNTALTNEANKRYDTLKSKITMAVNKLKDMAITVGNKLMPTIEKIITGLGKWIDKFDKLSDKEVDTIVNIGLIVAAIGPLLTIVGKLTSTIGGFTEGIGTVVQAIGVMQGNITATSTAATGLAKVFSGLTSPIGIACIAIGASIAGIAGAWTLLTSETRNALNEAKDFADSVETQKKAMEDYNKSIDETRDSNLAQIDSVKELKDELLKLVDTNGKVKEGYEGRVSFILNELNNALGTEYKLTDNVIDNYKQLKTSIEEVIDKKRASIILNASEEKYKDAITREEEATNQLKQATDNLNMSREEAIEKIEELKKKKEEQGYMSGWVAVMEMQNTQNEIDTLENKIKAYDDANANLKTIYDNWQAYETNYAAFTEGKYTEISNTIIGKTKDWTSKSLEELRNTITEEEKNLNMYSKIYEETGNEIALKRQQQAQKSLEELAKELSTRASTVKELGEDEKEAWKQLATSSYSIYYDTISRLPPELAKKIQEMTGVTAEKTPELVEETSKMSQKVIEQIKASPEFKKEAINNLKAMLKGLEDEDLRQLLYDAGVDNVEEVMKGIKKGDLAEEKGTNILENLNKGLKNQDWKSKLWNTARNIASTLSGLLTVKASVNGKTSTLPGHKLGLDYVPKDNYVARLHKGERVLTKEENESYTEAEQRSKRSGSSNSVFATEIDYNKMANAMTKALTSCKFTLDEDGFAKIVKDELYKVV